MIHVYVSMSVYIIFISHQRMFEAVSWSSSLFKVGRIPSGLKWSRIQGPKSTIRADMVPRSESHNDDAK